MQVSPVFARINATNTFVLLEIGLNTCKYVQYVQILTIRAYTYTKYIQVYQIVFAYWKYVYCTFMIVYTCIYLQQVAWVMGKLSVWSVFVYLCMYRHVSRQYMIVWQWIQQQSSLKLYCNYCAVANTPTRAHRDIFGTNQKICLMLISQWPSFL